MHRTLRRRSTLTVSLALVLPAVFAGAQAGAFSFQPFYEYTVAFTGHGSYTRSSTRSAEAEAVS